MQMDRQYRTIPTFRDIDRACCVKFGVTRDLLRSPSRRPRVTKARQVAMYLMRQLTGKSLPSIGNYFTRDHATVMHADSSVKALIASDPNMSATISEIITAIKAEPSEMDKLREWSARLAAGEVSWVVPPPPAAPPAPVEVQQIIYTDPLALRLAAVAAGQG